MLYIEYVFWRIQVRSAWPKWPGEWGCGPCLIERSRLMCGCINGPSSWGWVHFGRKSLITLTVHLAYLHIVDGVVCVGCPFCRASLVWVPFLFLSPTLPLVQETKPVWAPMCCRLSFYSTTDGNFSIMFYTYRPGVHRKALKTSFGWDRNHLVGTAQAWVFRVTIADPHSVFELRR